MEYAGSEGPVNYAGEGPGGFGQQGDRTVIEGGDSRFVVEYVYDQAADAASRSADLTVEGGNNEFVLRVDGAAGGSDITIDGGNNRFVVIFDNASGGGNTVNVAGGNNQFVVRFNYLNGQGEGDVVSVDGANNQYVVETNTNGESGPVSDIAVAGPGGGFGTLPGGQSVAENGGSYDFGAFGNSADSPLLAMFGGGAGGGPVYDFSAFGNADVGGTSAAGSMGGSPFGGRGNPFGSMPAGGDGSGGDQAGGQGSDLASLLAQSPFGRLLDLPGIEGPEDIFGNVAGNFGGGNPFEGTGATPGSNPFAGLGGGANPFAGGSGGIQAAPSGAGGEDGAGGAANPFAALAAGGQPSNPGYDFGGLQSAGNGDPDAAFAASPFGPLIGLPGIDGPEDIFGDGFAAAFGGSQDGDAASDDTGGDAGVAEADAACVSTAEFSPIG